MHESKQDWEFQCGGNRSLGCDRSLFQVPFSVPSPSPHLLLLGRGPLYLWYDYFCCPQGVDEPAVHSRHLAIDGIPSYVARCELPGWSGHHFCLILCLFRGEEQITDVVRYFVVLCPVLLHSDHGVILEQTTWSLRGWCRMERLARELSERNDGHLSAFHESI